MSDDKPKAYDLSRRKALLGLGTIGAAAVGAGMGTSALFSDEESFVNNSITAGTTNLQVTMGLVEVRSTASASDLQINFSPDPKTADGQVRTGVQVGDMKPGDCIVVRTTVNVQDNPMYVALTGDDVDESGGASTEPELDVDPDNSGDLADNLEITFGYDSDRSSLHDSTLEGTITADAGSSTYTGTQFLTSAGNGFLYRGRNGSGGSPPGGHGDGSAAPTRIGDPSHALTDRDKVTHFIEICLPTDVGNEVQGDILEFDLVWNAEQARNNADPGNSDAVDGNVN
jgi:predicted ribosomally synthesized peptide with SipW-like signal peptide